MASVEEHYENLLAEHYTWMRGGHNSNVREYRSYFERANISPRSDGKALDLGSGSGFQSIALADQGFQVLSVDSNEALLEELSRETARRAIRPVLGDIRDSGVYGERGPFEVAVCMGDTLTHLGSYKEVVALTGGVRDSLESGGRLVLEFRDMTRELEGVERAIPVRTDETRVMATFLEYEPEHVNVHDMIFFKDASGWTMHRSAYKKLRIGAGRIIDLLEKTGFRLVERSEDKGFTRIIAQV